MKTTWFPRNNLSLVLLLIVVSALAYLPRINQIGYTSDDWYLMYSAHVYGPRSFIDIFSVDRPARALVMIPAYLLFKDNVLLYNLSAYLFRVISAIGLLWLLQMLWPRQRSLTFLAALLFLIYPGFLSQANGIDYQSQQVSLAAAVLSIALNVKSSLVQKRIQKIFLFSAAVILGWLYLGLVEYFIGFEVLRWASFYILESRSQTSWQQGLVASIRKWLPSLIIPIAFLVWRLFFFVSKRGATDVDLQFGTFRLYPLQTIYHWTIQVIQNLFTVMLGAWVTPLSQLTGYIQIWGGILALITAISFVLVLFKLEQDFVADNMQQTRITWEALGLGLLVAVTGLIPIVMVNRGVSFPSYSRYSLVSSVGVAIFIVALLNAISSRILRYSLLGTLILIAMLTHHANAINFAEQSAIIRNFWWQVAWRVPQLAPRTTLVGNYPAAIEEDYFIWGPANLIYYPEKKSSLGIQPDIFAAVLNRDALIKILTRERQEFDNRKNIITYKNYRNILILSQPSPASCVQAINGAQPEFSTYEWDSIRVIGSYSELEHILVDKAPHIPPVIVFGPEPSRGWCYYFQKADLARQRGDWNEILQLANEASNKDLKPGDLIEWMPFLQAFALNNKTDQLIQVFDEIQSDKYVNQQACQLLNSWRMDSDIQNMIESKYCVSP